MDELPELPFELVLSYLSLEDRLKARAVSRRWYHQIIRFKVKTLCYSQRPAGFIRGKGQLVSGAFAQNFISAKRFVTFFNTFSSTILSNLKHLRLCDLSLNLSTFVSTLQSFGQLEELDIIRFTCPYSTTEEIELTLPMLINIRLKGVLGLRKLTLDAPRLLKITLADDHTLRLDLVHAESVEWLMIDRWAMIEVEKLKNLKYFYPDLSAGLRFHSTFLSSLEQLKEIHLDVANCLEELFEQKQRHRRTDLKIYLLGLLLNGPHDPAIGYYSSDWKKLFLCLAENPSRLADQIPLLGDLNYLAIKHVAPGTEISLLKRFTNLTEISVYNPVGDTERFLNLLKNLDNIESLVFECYQRQDLFDRLPEHCAVQSLITIGRAHLDHRFLFRMKNLVDLKVKFSIDVEAIRKVIEENEFLSKFEFKYLGKEVIIEHPKLFRVWDLYAGFREVADLDGVIKFITRE